jgi:hypothetical protein
MTGDRGSDPLSDLVISILITVTIVVVVLVSTWWLFR